jgi:ankyrin repeat protein
MLKSNQTLALEFNQRLETGLHQAIRSRSSKLIITTLLEYGSDVNTKDLNGKSCLDIAEQI